MKNELKYQVRSREIGDLVAMLRSGRLIMSAYFQRNLVWRDAHKHDFIETILEGLPFPQIFLARGEIDVQKLESFTCVVDGQQRLNAIREYVGDKFSVRGKLFSQLSTEAKTAFIKYEVPVIDFDLDAGDPRLKDVFKRLNRTFYSLSIIERLATEYSASEYLLTARVLCGDITTADIAEQEAEAIDILDDPLPEIEDTEGVPDANEFVRDPGISPEYWKWLQAKSDGAFSKILATKKIFSAYEFQRKVPLIFVLNVMSTILAGYYNRNSKVKEYLEDYNVAYSGSAEMIDRLNSVATLIHKFSLGEEVIWWNKANFFTMVCEIAVDPKIADIDVTATSKALEEFGLTAPGDFLLAAREGVNDRAQRKLRAEAFRNLLRYTT